MAPLETQALREEGEQTGGPTETAQDYTFQAPCSMFSSSSTFLGGSVYVTFPPLNPSSPKLQ